MIEKLWVEIPIRAQRISNTLTDVLLDGFYLAAFPGLSVALHVLVLVGGFASGWLHPGFRTVFSESMFFMIVAGAIGMLSARMGLLFVISFAIGDFFLVSHRAFYDHGLIRNFLEVRVPLLIEYSLLGMLLIGIPLVVKQMVGTFRPPSKLSDTQLIFVAAGLMGVLTGVLVFFWAQAAPLLMRPIFVWNQSPSAIPTAMAMPLQTQWYIIVVALSVVAYARVWIQYRIDTNEGIEKTLGPLKEQLSTAKPVVPLTIQISPILLAIISSVWIVFLLSGMLTNWLQVIILVVVFAAFSALRSGIILLPLGPLPTFMYKVPFIARFLAGVILIVWVANQAVTRRFYGDGFEAIIITVVLSSAIFFILMPPISDSEEKKA